MKRKQLLLGTSLLVWFVAILSWAGEGDQPPTARTTSGVPVCIGCYETGRLNREKTYEDSSCRADYGDDAPRLIYNGYCARYSCLLDLYYSYYFYGWTPGSMCTNQELDDPTTCPNGTCMFLPTYSKTIPWSTDRDHKLTAAEASQIVRRSMTQRNER